MHASCETSGLGCGAGWGLSEEELKEGEVGGGGEFGVGVRVFHQLDGLAQVGAGRGIVGEAEALGAGGGEGAADDGDAEGLRGLDGPEAGAVEVMGDEGGAVGFLNGVGDPLGGDGGAGELGGLERGFDDGGAGAGAGGVLDGDEVAGGWEGLEAIPDGLLAFGTAGDEAGGFAELEAGLEFGEGGREVGSNHEDEFVDGGGMIEALPGMGDEGAVGDGEEEFIASHAGAVTGGDDDGADHRGWGLKQGGSPLAGDCLRREGGWV